MKREAYGSLFISLTFVPLIREEWQALDRYNTINPKVRHATIHRSAGSGNDKFQDYGL